MSGYVDEPDDLPVGSPYWYVGGAYGYWHVEQRTVGETGSSGHTLSPMTRKLATAVSEALNEAYRRGLHDRVHAPGDRPCRDRSTCPGWQKVS